MLDFKHKFIPFDRLSQWRENIREIGLILVVTNGCFDILHIGHVIYLQEAKRLGDVLLVGVNGDESVRAIKGLSRPIIPELERAYLVASLFFVDAVTIFKETTAIRFLEMVRPDIYVKGGDYTIHTINQDERHLVESLGGRVEIVAGIPGRSTTSIVERIKNSTISD